jgi:hypothetical protein
VLFVKSLLIITQVYLICVHPKIGHLFPCLKSLGINGLPTSRVVQLRQSQPKISFISQILLHIPDGGKKLGTQLDAATGLRLVASEQGVLVLIE